LFDRAESSLYFATHELRTTFPHLNVVPVVGDILDGPHVLEVLRTNTPDVIYHAAAYKHVPIMEDQPIEATANNVFGTEIVASAAQEVGVKKFVLISTDKAVKAVGVMGMTKRVAECVLFTMTGSTTASAVRFGNVLGSDGSVLPLFQRQIALGRPITVTDPDATRYFMLLSEAAQLVLQAGAMGQGGEVFFLDMGKPLRILDMAKNLIRLSGLEPSRDVPLQVVGLRRGERLNEELLMEQEDLLPSGHEKVFVVQQRGFDAESFRAEIKELKSLVAARNRQGVLEQLRRMVGQGEAGSVVHHGPDLRVSSSSDLSRRPSV
jgi:FlaA1/EpsC-like NDP-sugar epimerase